MADLIERDALFKQIEIDSEGIEGSYGDTWKFIDTIKNMPSVDVATDLQPENRLLQGCKDTIQKFHDYQVEWLRSHHDVTFDHDTEELIIHFLHDTANCYMMEVNNG